MKTIGGTCELCGAVWQGIGVPDDFLIPVGVCPQCYEKEKNMNADLAAKGSDLAQYGKSLISGKDLFDKVDPISEKDDYVAIKDNIISFCHCGKEVVTISKDFLKKIYQKVIEEEARQAVGKK